MPKKHFYSEPELLMRLSQSDESALSQIYLQYWKPLFISAFNAIREKAACEDIVQEIFVQLWMKRSQLEIHDSLQAYLFAATRYQVFSFLKKTANREVLLHKLENKSTAATTDECLLQKDLCSQVEKAVAGLPEKCRRIYRLSRENNLTHKEIAEQLSISPKTVENQLTIALHRVRTFLKEAMALMLLFNL